MKKLLFIPILVLLLALVGCGLPGEPMLDDMYPRDMYFTEGYRIILEGDSKVWIEFRPELDFDVVKKNAVPVSYEREVFTGFALPIWDGDANIDEELFFDICVPDRWDGTSTSHIHIDCFLPDEQTKVGGEAFKLQIHWEHYTPNVDVVPGVADPNPITVETTTGDSLAFQSFQINFDIPAEDMLSDDILAFRLRRVVATVGNDIGADELVIIQHVGVIFLCDKLGNPDPY